MFVCHNRNSFQNCWKFSPSFIVILFNLIVKYFLHKKRKINHAYLKCCKRGEISFLQNYLIFLKINNAISAINRNRVYDNCKPFINLTWLSISQLKLFATIFKRKNKATKAINEAVAISPRPLSSRPSFEK